MVENAERANERVAVEKGSLADAKAVVASARRAAGRKGRNPQLHVPVHNWQTELHACRAMPFVQGWAYEGQRVERAVADVAVAIEARKEADQKVHVLRMLPVTLLFRATLVVRVVRDAQKELRADAKAAVVTRARSSVGKRARTLKMLQGRR